MSELLIPLQPKQQGLLALIERSKATRIGAGGAFGAAKSHALRSCALIRGYRHPGRRLIMRRKSKELLDNHLEPLWKQFPFLRKKYNQQHNTLTLSPKSVLVFGYAEHPARNNKGSIYDFQGSEWDDIFIDEATHFNEEELVFMSLRCRETTGDFIPKNVWAMNPGNIGHSYIKRVMIDRRYEPTELPRDFAFLQSFGWDNVEWVRKELAADGLTEKDYYYGFNSRQRFQWFITRSNYGRVLNGLKGKVRLARLMGDWNAFAGQFFDIWNEATAVMQRQIEPWHPRWVSMDWGYEHNAAVYWHTQDGDHTHTYRELVIQHCAPAELGHKIGEMSRGEKIQDFYLSPDAFELSGRKWSTDGMISDQIGDACSEYGVPRPSRADNSRISGWRLMHEMLSAECWTVDPSCERLITCLPELMRDDDNREDVLKVDCDEDGEGGDDPADGCRYGLKSKLAPRSAPVEVRVRDRVETFAQQRGLTARQLEPTSVASLTRRAIQLEKRKPHWTRFRPGRPY